MPSTITEKMAAVHFPSNALRSNIFRKANGCLLKDRRKAAGRFFYSVDIGNAAWENVHAAIFSVIVDYLLIMYVQGKIYFYIIRYTDASVKF